MVYFTLLFRMITKPNSAAIIIQYVTGCQEPTPCFKCLREAGLSFVDISRRLCVFRMMHFERHVYNIRRIIAILTSATVCL